MNFVERLRGIAPLVKTEEPLAKHTTYGIGGPAEVYAEPHNRQELRGLLLVARECGKTVFIIGNGSNLLVDDGGMRGLIIHLGGEFENLHIEGDSVVAGAGVMIPVLVKRCAEAGLSGIEGLAGIPGSVGGGLAMNAGTSLGEFYDHVQWVDLMDSGGEILRLERAAMDVRYRRANLKGSVALETELKLTGTDKVAIMQKINSYLNYRAQTQPLGTQNVGSVFKNPSGDHAGRLVEAAGLKGTVIGGAQISLRHANFIVNVNKAKANDVKALIERAKHTVKERFGIELETEVKIVGDPERQ